MRFLLQPIIFFGLIVLIYVILCPKVLIGKQKSKYSKVKDPRFQHVQNFSEHIYKIPPLVLISDGKKMLLPGQDKLDKNGCLTVKKSEQVVLYCSGYNNHLATTKNEQVANIFEDYFPPNSCFSHEYPFGHYPKDQIDKARCLSPMLAMMETLHDEPCANGQGIKLRVGFFLSETEYIKMYEICFVKLQIMSAIYTTHELLGTELLLPEEEFKMPMSRKSKSVMSQKTPGAPFFWDIQEAIFRRLFVLEVANWYLSFKNNEGLLYIAAPLTPPGDFYYLPLKVATHIFENAVPIFCSIYRGNWLTVQIIGRILAIQVKTKLLKVISGTLDLLQLPNNYGGEKNVYLDIERNGPITNRYRPIPKYLYKIFYDPQTKTGIAFVTLNNPFFEFVKTDFPCKDVTKFFMDINFFNPISTAGPTICCKVQDLQKKVNDLKDINLNLEDRILSLDVHNSELPLHHLQPNWKSHFKTRNRKMTKLSIWSPGAKLDD